jgi:hypothetical protein
MTMADFYYSWQVSQLRHATTGELVAGRLQAAASITVEEVGVNAPQSATAPAPFELFGPGDVQRLASGVITRRFPAPGTFDAEETKRALVEFSRADTLDLPWRYSPDAGTPDRIKPWLVLVVGEPGDITVTRDGRVALSATVQEEHKLDDSHLWAHVQVVDGISYSRILSPKELKAQKQYTACLVPAYMVDPDGTLRQSWPSADGQSVRLPCYDAWSFHTGEQGDFRDLAKQLRTPAPNELRDSFGRADIRYPKRGSGDPTSATLATAGALQRLSMAGVSFAPTDAWVAQEIAALADNIPTPAGRWVLTPPLYHGPFTPPGTQPTAGWSHQFHTDPRDRGAAGLGAWASIAWQERIADAAATKAGDLGIARDRIGHVALGLEATRSLWYRHMPPDPVDKLDVLGAMLGRMPVDADHTVASALSGRTPGMSAVIWSSAARRALRPGPARSVLTKDGAIPFRQLLKAAASCPDRQKDPEAIWSQLRARRADPEKGVRDILLQAFRQDEQKAKAVLQRLIDAGGLTSLNALAALFAALVPGDNGEPNPDLILRAIARPAATADESEIGQLIDALGERLEPCRPIDLDALGKRIADAVDPFAARPPVVERVLGTLPGFKDIGPVEIEPELDLPFWHFLNDASPDWLLPGIGELKPGRVVALATNPAFVEGFLVGANHQALGELRWRNMPIAPRWSPLRKFWQRAGGEMDIVPINTWPDASILGGAGLAPAGLGIEAVVLFHTPLFRRYPATVVYLYERDAGWTPPPSDQPLDEAKKHYPTFTGKIGPDITFFGFQVEPAALANHWVVLEEPPAGYRFYGKKDDTVMPTTAATTGAAYGSGTFASPVRVMIGKLGLA